MNNRLQTIFNLISSKTGIIDVGTDHGYIPIALAQSGYNGNIFASDINRGPLNSAIQNASEHNVEDNISFFLSDGLKACPREKVDTIIIAGMGGDLIVRILEDAPWCIDSAYTLILQPMTKQDVLRSWLIGKGFSVKTYLSPEKQRYYQILCARYCAESVSVTPAQLITGALEDISEYDFFSEYMDFHIRVVQNELNGQMSSKNCDALVTERLGNIISELRTMKESVKNDQ